MSLLIYSEMYLNVKELSMLTVAVFNLCSVLE